MRVGGHPAWRWGRSQATPAWSCCTMEHLAERFLEVGSLCGSFGSPFDRQKLSRNTKLRDPGLPLAARETNCPYLAEVRLFRNLVLANCQRTSHYRAVTPITRVNGEMKILLSH